MSEGNRGKKRPKSYYIKCAGGGKKAKRSNDLDAGMKGFLVTCNKYEKEVVREMYNILNEYADKLYGPEVKPDKKAEAEEESESEEEDMEKAMAKEAAKLKEVSTATERRFQNTNTKTKNCIFIRTSLDNPCELAHEIFSDIVEKQVQKARYALRMIPIQVTCKTNMDNIKEAAEGIFKPHFDTDFGVGVKYTSVCKIRNNDKMSRHTILPTLGSIIKEMNPLHSLCHDEPDVIIIIEIIRNVCCLSVSKDYFTYKKFNLHEVVRKPADGNDVSKDASKEEAVIDEDIKKNVLDDKTETNDDGKKSSVEDNLHIVVDTKTIIDAKSQVDDDSKTATDVKPQTDDDTKTNAEVKPETGDDNIVVEANQCISEGEKMTSAKNNQTECIADTVVVDKNENSDGSNTECTNDEKKVISVEDSSKVIAEKNVSSEIKDEMV